MSQVDLLLRSVRPAAAAQTDPVDVVCDAGVIVAVGAGAAEGLTARHEIDGSGALVSPAFVEAHWHADKFESLALDDGASAPGADRVRAIKGRYTTDDVAARAERGMRLALAYGVTRARVTVDVSPAVGLVALNGVLTARQALGDLMDIELCALPEGSGLRDRPTRDLVEEAIGLGVGVVGAYPNGAGDRAAGIEELDVAFALAEHHDVPLDVHVDEEAGELLLEPLAERVLARGWGHRTIADHCVGLESAPTADRERVLALVAEAGLPICLMPNNLLWEPQARGGLAMRRTLADAGITVCAGTDNVHDGYFPYGNLDPIERAFLAAIGGAGEHDDDAFAAWGMVTTDAARALGLRPGAVEPGAPADLVVCHDAPDVVQAMRRLPRSRTTIRRGIPVAGVSAETWVRD